jgi:hypothetical protein
VEHTQLPPTTRQIWDRSAEGRLVRLCALPLPDFAWLLGFPEWLTQHAATMPASESPFRFILERTGYLLTDLAPVNATEPTLLAESTP